MVPLGQAGIDAGLGLGEGEEPPLLAGVDPLVVEETPRLSRVHPLAILGDRPRVHPRGELHPHRHLVEVPPGRGREQVAKAVLPGSLVAGVGAHLEHAVRTLVDRREHGVPERPPAGVARRFADEARATAQLQRPDVPLVHDYGILPDGRPFLAMKLIKGRTLADPPQR
jgi:hypothetical protein